MTKLKFAYFAFDGELIEVRTSVERVVGFRLSERESSYWGGVYFLYKDDSKDFRLKLHRNIGDNGRWILHEFPGAQIVCSLQGTVTDVDSTTADIEKAHGRQLAVSVIETNDVT